MHFGFGHDNAHNAARLQDIKINRKRFGGLQCVALGGIGQVIDWQDFTGQ